MPPVLVNEQPLLPDHSVTALQQNLTQTLSNLAYTINQLITTYAQLAGVSGAVAWADVVHQITGQNRFRYKNSVVTASGSGNQSMPNSVVTLLDWVDASDPDAILATNVFTVKLAGVYMISCHVSWASNPTGERLITWTLNGGGNSHIARQAASAVDDTVQPASFGKRFTAGDVLRFYGYQNSGGALNAQGAASFLTMAYIGE